MKFKVTTDGQTSVEDSVIRVVDARQKLLMESCSLNEESGAWEVSGTVESGDYYRAMGTSVSARFRISEDSPYITSGITCSDPSAWTVSYDEASETWILKALPADEEASYTLSYTDPASGKRYVFVIRSYFPVSLYSEATMSASTLLDLSTPIEYNEGEAKTLYLLMREDSGDLLHNVTDEAGKLSFEKISDKAWKVIVPATVKGDFSTEINVFVKNDYAGLDGTSATRIFSADFKAKKNSSDSSSGSSGGSSTGGGGGSSASSSRAAAAPTTPQTPASTPVKAFLDVPQTAYYADAVNWAVEKGITAGTSDETFSPNKNCSRAEIAVFLWRLAGSPAPQGSGNFGDVSADSYYANAVQWAVENGITAGYAGGVFYPNAICTRAQVITFLWRMAGRPEPTINGHFVDVAPGDYYSKAVLWAEEQGITAGTGNDRFSPGANCTRAQIVTLLYRSENE